MDGWRCITNKKEINDLIAKLLINQGLKEHRKFGDYYVYIHKDKGYFQIGDKSCFEYNKVLGKVISLEQLFSLFVPSKAYDKREFRCLTPTAEVVKMFEAIALKMNLEIRGKGFTTYVNIHDDKCDFNGKTSAFDRKERFVSIEDAIKILQGDTSVVIPVR